MVSWYKFRGSGCPESWWKKFLYNHAKLRCVITRACTAFQGCSPLLLKPVRGSKFRPQCPWSCKYYLRSLRVSDLKEYMCLLHDGGFSGEDTLDFCPWSLRTTAHLCHHRVQISGEYLGKSSTLSRAPCHFLPPFRLLLGSDHADHNGL